MMKLKDVALVVGTVLGFPVVPALFFLLASLFLDPADAWHAFWQCYVVVLGGICLLWGVTWLIMKFCDW